MSIADARSSSTRPSARVPAPRPWRLGALLALLLGTALALLPYMPLTLYDGAATGGTAASSQAGSPADGSAMQTITFLSQGTRAVGDPYHDTARDWLSAELRGLGLEVQEQQFPAEGQPVPLVNVVGRLAGTNPAGEAVLIMAHYDSHPGSPGASDNGSGVSIVLEIARAAAQGPRPANDLIVLFTDGEEQGILGVPPFLDAHPWAEQVRVALNFDGISTGPVFLWQTGPQNGRLIDLYAGTPRPWALSWVDGIARVLPLDTDFRPFLQAGYPGGSFTTPYLPLGYHTPGDGLALVNPATIRHGIEQGTAITTALLASDLSAAQAPDRVYLSLWGGLLITYPAGFATGLGLLAGLLALAALVFSLRGGQARPRAVGAAALFTAANMLLVFLVQFAFELAFFLTRPLTPPWVKIPLSLALLLVLLGFAYRRAQRRLSPRELLHGARLVWAACAVWSSLANPLFSPPLALALLVSLLPEALALLRAAVTAQRAGSILALALIMLLGGPVVYLLYMIAGLMWIPAAIAAVAVAMLVALVQPVVRLVEAG